jgi:predicted RNA binding protein YcfA (HicA-like mRNA interferase family)
MADDLYKTVIGLIEENGGEFVRMGKGSHSIWKGGNGRKTTVPKNLKRRHTANAILKQLDIDAKI